MPQYDVECEVCKLRAVIFRKVEERNDLPLCGCGGKVQRLISKPYLGGVNFTAFISPATGEVVDSPTKWREDLRKSGSIPYEPGLKQDIARNREYAKEKAFEPVARAVDDILRAKLAVDPLET